MDGSWIDPSASSPEPHSSHQDSQTDSNRASQPDSQTAAFRKLLTNQLARSHPERGPTHSHAATRNAAPPSRTQPPRTRPHALACGHPERGPTLSYAANPNAAPRTRTRPLGTRPHPLVRS
eukprot:360394-Chlamydomonas_euryale.AAC.2